jgi:hypothetical protein
MGGGSVTNPGGKAPSWKLASPHDTQAQGIVVSGFNALPSALALFLEFDPKQSASAAGQGPAGNWQCAEHDRQLGGESLLSSLIVAKD